MNNSLHQPTDCSCLWHLLSQIDDILNWCCDRTKVAYFFHPLFHFLLLSLKLPPRSSIEHPPTDTPSHVSNLKNSAALPGIKEDEFHPMRTRLSAWQHLARSNQFALFSYFFLSVCLDHWHNKIRFISLFSHCLTRTCCFFLLSSLFSEHRKRWGISNP